MASLFKLMTAARPMPAADRTPHGRRAAVGSVEVSKGQWVSYVRDDIMREALNPKSRKTS